MLPGTTCGAYRFQERAHASEVARGEVSAEFRRRAAKFPTERLSKMGVTGKAEIEREHCKVSFAISQPLQCKAQPQTSLLSMQTRAGLAMKEPRQMKRRAENSSRQFTQAQLVTTSSREHDARCIDQIPMRLPSTLPDWLPSGASLLISARYTVRQGRSAHFLDGERIHLRFAEETCAQPVKI